ncbi:hypothetical protein KUTeg_007541 [Tegillarca granosa]|uniref:LisH domain-containing protein n=1 Tax=Tegillarca granosa TaxID=220873 RepID=A0ABQ9FFI5_TEGGR|nr:hypothetical protein KUTeg_007541 [Tegillarca granosa]
METNNRYFLPSEVARLVLGYLQTESFSCSYKSFLKECPHLEEYSIYLKRGQSYPLTINGFTLIQMLEEYASLKITDTQRRQHEPSVGSLWRQFDSVVQCLKVQTASKFLRVDGKTQNARMRTQRLIFKRGQNEINIKNTGQNEDASKQTVVSKESHIKSQNTTGREIEGVSGFTGTSASTLSSMLHQNIVDSTSCDSDPHVDSTSVPDFNNHALQQTFETEQISHTTNSQTFDTHQISRTLDVQTFDTPLITRVTDSSEQLSYTAPRSVDSKVYDKRYCDFKSSVFMNATTSDSIRHADSLRMPGNIEYQHANSIPPSPVIQGSQVKSPVYTNQSSSVHAQIDSPAVISNTKINSLGDSQELMPSLNTVQSSSELFTINSPAVLSNNDIKKMKSISYRYFISIDNSYT